MNQLKISALLSVFFIGMFGTPALAQIARPRTPIVRPDVKPKPPPVSNHRVSDQFHRSVYPRPDLDHDERLREEGESDDEANPNYARSILIVVLVITISAMIYVAIVVPD